LLDLVPPLLVFIFLLLAAAPVPTYSRAGVRRVYLPKRRESRG